MDFSDYTHDRLFDLDKIAATLRTSAEEVAITAGLSADALQNPNLLASDAVQRRLRDMFEVMNAIQPRCGSALVAYALYRSEALPGFDGFTPMRLVQDGKANQVLEYIDAVDVGVFT